ncbi:MAG TPA: ABC transporter permease [Candidatus Saccharimonadia bacterium]|nr:ABC transporter permease [Candidatus Saccharimonadia bacterium]
MEVIYGIPVIGIVFQLVAYLVQEIPSLGPTILSLATPVALGALCGVMCERSGVVNIGIEGIMLFAAFFGFIAAGFAAQAFPTESAGTIFAATPALVVGVIVAVAVAVLISSIHAWLSISIRADQIISGTIINIFAIGLTGYLNRLIITPNPSIGAGTFNAWEPPTWLVDIPVIGWVFDMFLSQGPLSMIVIVLVVGFQIMLFRSRWGLRTRSVGEHPKAADTVGINVIWVRYRNVLIGGALAGLAGAYLTLQGSGSFQNNMVAGRGFIALAAVIVGRWTPLGAFGAALLFETFEALRFAINFSPPTGDLQQLGDLLAIVPIDTYAAMPYLVTLIVLAGVVGRSIPPAADGQPYVKEGKS